MLQAQWLEVGQNTSGRRAGSWGNHGNGWRKGLAASRLTSPTASKVSSGSGESRDWQVKECITHPVWWSLCAPSSPVAWPRNTVEGSNHWRGNGLPQKLSLLL